MDTNKNYAHARAELLQAWQDMKIDIDKLEAAKALNVLMKHRENQLNKKWERKTFGAK